MSNTKDKQVISPFPMSEEELKRRMEASKPLTQKQFIEKLEKLKSKKDSL
jgi:hypothetical protein